MTKFTKATRKRRKLRAALCGPAGAGKTYTALQLAKGLGGRIAVIDTEHGSASLYSDEVDFDVLELETGDAKSYAEAIKAAGKEGYNVLIIDSLSHAWIGTDGALEKVNNISRKTRNSFTAWRDVSPLLNRLVDIILTSPCHVICTMRSKMAYELVENDKGKKEPQKLGMAPVMRDGVEYEFDFVADIDLTHTMMISKTRFKDFADAVIQKADHEVGERLGAWLSASNNKEEEVRTKVLSGLEASNG